MRRLWPALFLLGCAYVPQEGISSFDALRLHEEGRLVVIDVRPSAEILRSLPKRPLVHIQYGPDEWGAVAENDARAFAEKVRSASDGKPIALLCQYGVRSAAAAAALRERGIAAQNITDGYLGNNHGPGWRASE